MSSTFNISFNIDPLMSVKWVPELDPQTDRSRLEHPYLA